MRSRCSSRSARGGVRQCCRERRRDIVVAAVSVARVALGRLSGDVLAAVVLGIGWLALCGAALVRYRLRGTHRMLQA